MAYNLLTVSAKAMLFHLYSLSHRTLHVGSNTYDPVTMASLLKTLT